MISRTVKVAIAAFLVIVIAIPLTVYALEYRGNYNVNVQFTVSKDAVGTMSASELEVTSEETSPWDGWDLFKDHGLEDRGTGYQVYLEITRNGVLRGFAVTAFLLENSESTTVSLTADNVSPGEAQVRVYATDLVTHTVVFDRTVTEMIP